MHHSPMMDAGKTRSLFEQARAIGFDLCSAVPISEVDDSEHFSEWLARGYAGEMHYLHDARRKILQEVLPGARSVIVCAMNYNAPRVYSTAALVTDEFDSASVVGDASAAALQSPCAWISRYAWGDDYHDVVKRKLDELIVWMRHEFGGIQARAYVDTGPVLERIAAKQAGLGWLAKNTCLINQQLGSWLFLGAILTDLDLGHALADNAAPPRDLCGTCTRCIDACPTQAFVEPYVLDARRCISYLTIELRSEIPAEFRPAMGTMVFGCDICQDVCPWNRKAPATHMLEFQPRTIAKSEPLSAQRTFAGAEDVSLFRPPLEWLISLTESEFRRAFRGSAVKRAKWRGLLRNVCVAAGNSRITPENPAYSRIMQKLEELARSADPLLAEHAQWALDKLRANAGAKPVVARDTVAGGTS